MRLVTDCHDRTAFKLTAIPDRLGAVPSARIPLLK